MKKLIFLIGIIISICIIYYIKSDNELYLVTLGDNVINNDVHKVIINNINKEIEKDIKYTNENMSINDITSMLENNIKIKYKNKKYNILNVIIKSDIILLSLGNNEMGNYTSDKNKYNYIDSVMLDYDKLFNILRRYSKEKIVIINTNSNKYYISRLQEITSKYKIDIINVDKYNVSNKILNYINSVY